MLDFSVISDTSFKFSELKLKCIIKEIKSSDSVLKILKAIIGTNFVLNV